MSNTSYLRHLPNVITILRIFLVIPFVICLLGGHYLSAFILFAVAGLSDGLDGLLARRYGWTSYFGSFADPLADKLLMIAGFLSLAYLQALPFWVVAIVIGRDAIIMIAVSLYYYFSGIKIHFEPSLLSKYTTVFQVTLVGAILFELAFRALPHTLLMGLEIIVVVLTLVSMFHYMWVWGWSAYQNSLGKKQSES